MVAATMPNSTKTKVEAQIVEGLAALVEQGDVFEVRILGVDGNTKRTDAGYFDNVESAAKAIAEYDRRADGIYIVPNLTNPALLARAANRIKQYPKALTSDNDILRRRYLLIDADPVRPAGISSTDAEHEAALERINNVCGWLSLQGWPEAKKASSGNGGHALYDIDLPNDAESADLLSCCLNALADKFSDASTKIDTTPFNASRIWKAYGTVAGKGDSIPDRPHRRSKLISTPEQRNIVSIDLLKNLASMYNIAPTAHEPHRQSGESIKPIDVENWLRSHNIAYEAKKHWHGGSLWKLEKCHFSSDHTDGAFVAQFPSGAITAGCHHDRCKGRGWGQLREMYEGKREERQKAQRKSKFKKIDNLPAEPLLHLNGDSTPLHPMDDSSSKQSMSAMLLQALESLNMTFRLNRLEDNIEVDGKRLDDVVSAEINLGLVDKGFSRPNIADGVTVLAGRNAYHPIEDYLLGLKWDGHNHLRKLMDHLTGDGITIAYDGATVPLYASLFGRWLTGAVARALGVEAANPFRHQTPMLVIIGPQGEGKSSLIRWLVSGVGYEFHRESMINPHSIEDVRSMVTKWIWEVSELGSSLRRGDRDALKSFITQEWHTYRKPWGKHQITKPTLCNLVGTLNRETGFLDDPTGNRRFLPVTINAIDHGYSSCIDVNQLWAQIVELYRTGKTTPELNRAERDALQSVYREHQVENPLATYISMYFDVEPGNESMKCHTATIIHRLHRFGIRMPADLKAAGRELNDVLTPMGLQSGEFRVDGIKGRGWLGIQPNKMIPPDAG